MKVHRVLDPAAWWTWCGLTTKPSTGMRRRLQGGGLRGGEQGVLGKRRWTPRR